MLDVIRENIDDLVAFEGFACKPSLSRSDGDSFEAIPSTKCVLRRSCPEVYECAQDALQMMNIMISACLMEMINAVSLYSGCFYAEAQRGLEAWKQVLVRIRKKEAGKKEVIALLGL